jgi:2,5-diamino-6-(ribosylamino)-4(3H)-pyrimidinone 5'-phosphate reductase
LVGEAEAERHSPRPYVLINVAATADGKIDTRERRGARISGQADSERVDRLRASVDGVMVGGHTLYAEDPRLTVRSEALVAERIARGQPPQPARIAIASHFALRPDARFLSGPTARILLFVPRGKGHSTEAKAEGVEVVPPGAAHTPLHGVELYECGHPRVDLVQALQVLARLGLKRLMVEGGGTLNFELLRLGLVDELQVYVAPMVFGGATAPTLADGDGFGRDAAIRLAKPEVEQSPDGGVVLRYMVEQS